MTYISPNDPKHHKNVAVDGEELGKILRPENLEELSRRTGFGYHTLSKIAHGHISHVTIEKAQKILEAMGKRSLLDGLLTKIPSWLSVQIDNDVPAVRCEFVKKIVEEWIQMERNAWAEFARCEPGGREGSIVKLAERSYVNQRLIGAIMRGERKLTSLSVADRIWVATGHAGPLPDEAWARDSEGRKIRGFKTHVEKECTK